MSTFSEWNGPAGFVPRTKDVTDLINAYTSLITKLEAHISKEVPESEVHGIVSYVKSVKAELETLIGARATITDLNTVRSEVNDKADTTAVQQLIQNVQQIVATKADSSVLSEYMPKSLFYVVKNTVDRLVTDLATLQEAWDEYSSKFSIEEDKLLFNTLIETTKHFIGDIKAHHLLDFTNWKYFTASYAGTGGQDDTDTNGLYILGHLSEDWFNASNPPDQPYKPKSAIVFVKYVNDKPFDAILQLTATSMKNGAITAIASFGEEPWQNMKYHLLLNSDSEGKQHVYLAVSADGLSSQPLQFRVAGINFIPGGSVNGIVKSLCFVHARQGFSMADYPDLGRIADLQTDIKESVVTAINELLSKLTLLSQHTDSEIARVSQEAHDLVDGLLEQANQYTDTKVEELDDKLDAKIEALDSKHDEDVARIDSDISTLSGEVVHYVDMDTEPTKGSNKAVTSGGIYSFVKAMLEMPVGATMFWPDSECVEQQVHSDHPFTFTVNGIDYSVEPEDPVTLTLNISKNVPEGWHALDGTAELDASEYPELADFFVGNNTTTEGKIWLPYVQQKIIKIK